MLLGFALTLLAIPFFSSAQTSNCTVSNVHFDEPAPGAPVVYSLKISVPAGCNGSPANAEISTTGSYTCPGGARYYDTERKIESDGVTLKAKCDVYPYHIQTSDHYITVKFLPHVPGYYCNRTNPLLPKCEYRTTGTNNTPLAQCSETCKIDSQYYANIAHHKVNQTEQKRVYEVGDKIEFVGSTNAGGTNNRYSWNFGDNMWTSGTSLSYAPVIYKTPGIKKVTFNVTNSTGQSYISTSTEVKIRCDLPDGSTDNINLIKNSLYANLKVKIADNSWEEWMAPPVKYDLMNWVEDAQCYVGQGYAWDVLFDRDNQANKIVNYLFAASNEKKAVPLVLLYTNQNLNQTIPDPSILLKNAGLHAVISLSIVENSDLTGRRYKVEFLDPGLDTSSGMAEPRVAILECREKKITNTAAQTGEVLVCDDPALSFYFKNVIFLNPAKVATNFYQDYIAIASNLNQNKNTAEILRSNHLNFGNYSGPTELSSKGVCAGWSDLSLRLAYLANFAGECKPITNTAAVGLSDLSNLLLKIREFLERSMPLLSR